jgi:hypothetical protein
VVCGDCLPFDTYQIRAGFIRVNCTYEFRIAWSGRGLVIFIRWSKHQKKKSHHSFIRSLTAALAVTLTGACLTAQADQIPGDPNGWCRSNVNVRILDVDNRLLLPKHA